MECDGTSAGFPDYLILIPRDRSENGLGYLFAIELKRRTGGTVSPAQREWIHAFNGLGIYEIQAYVCRGAAEAIKTISAYLSTPTQVF